MSVGNRTHRVFVLPTTAWQPHFPRTCDIIPHHDSRGVEAFVSDSSAPKRGGGFSAILVAVASRLSAMSNSPALVWYVSIGAPPLAGNRLADMPRESAPYSSWKKRLNEDNRSFTPLAHAEGLELGDFLSVASSLLLHVPPGDYSHEPSDRLPPCVRVPPRRPAT